MANKYTHIHIYIYLSTCVEPLLKNGLIALVVLLLVHLKKLHVLLLANRRN